MSFCPHRLLLSSVRVRSPSCSAEQRFRTRLNYRQRKLTGLTYLSGNALQSKIASPPENNDDLETCARPSYHVLEDPTPGDDHGAGSFMEKDREVGGVIAKPEANQTVPVHLSNLEPLREPKRIVHYVQYDREGKRRHVRRQFVDQGVWERDMEIRSTSLYYDPKSIRAWRTTCRLIREARADGKPFPELPKLTDHDHILLKALGMASKEAFREAWDRLPKNDQGAHWHRLSLWLLCHFPSLMPDFLQITCHGPFFKPVFVAVTDCVQHLLRFFPDLLDRSFIIDLMHPDRWPVLLMPQRPVRIYVANADRDAVHYAWNLVREKRIHMAPNTILSFVKRFTQFRDVDAALKAIEMIKEAAHPAFRMNSEEVVRHCCKLLTIDFVVDEGGVRNFRILPKLLELGVPPTRDLMNVVLLNAFRSGDTHVSQGILDYMKDQELEPDAYTYMALLTDAVRVGDHERFQSLLQEIQVKEELRRNPWIMTKILHAHFLTIAKRRDSDEDPSDIFYSMLDMYGRLHDITPLKELLILPPHYVQYEDDVSAPSVVALYIMIATYLRCVKNMGRVEQIYSRFREFVLSGHESIAPLAATDHTYNEFLVAFRNSPAGLRPAVRVIEDMQHSSSLQGLPKEDGKKSGNGGIKQVKHTPPTVRTWTLLMSCFVFNKQPHAAEKVRAMMDKHGVRYDIDVWNMIINNYANSQNVPALARAFKQMEFEGIKPDSFTLNPLRYLRDPERLWVAIDELDRAEFQKGTLGSDWNAVGSKENEESLLEQGLQRLKTTPRQ
ncbi:hypothetical protein BDW72DRAFT_212718 [Aspergillus terricola var. indicus]